MLIVSKKWTDSLELQLNVKIKKEANASFYLLSYL